MIRKSVNPVTPEARLANAALRNELLDENNGDFQHYPGSELETPLCFPPENFALLCQDPSMLGLNKVGEMDRHTRHCAYCQETYREALLFAEAMGLENNAPETFGEAIRSGDAPATEREYRIPGWQAVREWFLASFRPPMLALPAFGVALIAIGLVALSHTTPTVDGGPNNGGTKNGVLPDNTEITIPLTKVAEATEQYWTLKGMRSGGRSILISPDRTFVQEQTPTLYWKLPAELLAIGGHIDRVFLTFPDGNVKTLLSGNVPAEGKYRIPTLMMDDQIYVWGVIVKDKSGEELSAPETIFYLSPRLAVTTVQKGMNNAPQAERASLLARVGDWAGAEKALDLALKSEATTPMDRKSIERAIGLIKKVRSAETDTSRTRGQGSDQ